MAKYDTIAKYYDGLFIGPFVKAHHKQALKFLAPYVKNNSQILDVGCGTGSFLKRLFKKNKTLRVFGVDESSAMIKRAQKKKIPNSNFQVAKAEDLPFPGNYFDLITCVDSLYHLNIEIFFQQCFKVLKPGGYFFIDTISIDHRKLFTKFSILLTRISPVWRKAKYLKFQEIETFARKFGFKTEKPQAKNYPCAPYYKTWLIIFHKPYNV